MRKKKILFTPVILFVIILSCAIFSTFFLISPQKANSDLLSEEDCIIISVIPSNHTDYGLSYPITYIFNITQGQSNLKAYRRFSTLDNWTQMTEKISDDFFNGINCVRFDYTNNTAYVSIAFPPESDEIYVKITDQNDKNLDVNFDTIAKYYDNRKCVVTFTADDWDDRYNENFKTACEKCQERKIWFTPGLITGRINNSTWSDIQEKVDLGYVEVASHSRTHPETPYDDYDSEINGSKQDIINNITLPNLYKKGSTEYVFVWIAPYGKRDEIVFSKLGQFKYLVSRDINDEIYGFCNWDSINGVYRTGYTIRMGENHPLTNVTTLNKNFDNVSSMGQIYHLMCHPWAVNWSDSSYAVQHLDYIANKTDVWYVGFGALYAYHYVEERNVVTVTIRP